MDFARRELGLRLVSKLVKLRVRETSDVERDKVFLSRLISFWDRTVGDDHVVLKIRALDGRDYELAWDGVGFSRERRLEMADFLAKYRLLNYPSKKKKGGKP